MRLHGSKGEVMMDPTGGALAVAVGSINAWSLEMTRDRVDVTCLQDTNKQFVQGLASVTGTLGGFWDTDHSLDIFDVAMGDVPALLKLIPSTLQPTYFWTGLAYLDASISLSATGAVTISSTFAAAGPWTREPVVLVARGGDTGAALAA